MEWSCEGGGEPEAVAADGLSPRYKGSVCVGIRLSGRVFRAKPGGTAGEAAPVPAEDQAPLLRQELFDCRAERSARYEKHPSPHLPA